MGVIYLQLRWVLYICNLDERFHRDHGISEKILEGNAGKFWFAHQFIKNDKKT